MQKLPETDEMKSWSWVRWANVVLASGLAVGLAWLLAAHGGQLYRQARFRAAGTAAIDGLAIYLDPQDEVITQSILVYGEWEIGESAEMRRLIRPGDTVVDVGANVGWYTLLASKRIGDSGRVIAFEPAPESRALLQRSIAANHLDNVTIEPKALSDKRGTLRLHIHKWNRGGNSVLDGPDREQTVEVEALPLDEYLANRDGEIGLIKIDVEGAEGLVLAGMKNILRRRRVRTLVVEFNPATCRRTGMDPEDVLRRVLAAGYGVRTLDVWSGQSNRLSESELIALAERMERDGSWTDLVFERDNGPPRE
jgi:FkbM family methyltransferase